MPSTFAAAFDRSDLGLRRGVVDLAPSSTRWPAVFQRAASTLRIDAPASALGIEHIGSTSVPGLAAKPILDIAVGLASEDGLDEIDVWLTGHGLLFRGERDAVRPDRLYGFEIEPMIRLANVHVIRHGDTEWSRYTAFRDHLRSSPADRDAYGTLKADLARRHPDDRIAYIDGKADFIVARRG